VERLPLPARIVRALGYPRVAQLSVAQQDALRFFWLDGLFAALAVALVDTYYTLYMLALGASNTQVGLVNSLLQFAGAVFSVPGALLAERKGHYKRVVLINMGILGRLMWLVMLIAPWLLGDARAVWLVLIAWVGIGAFNALGNAAWTALSADVVPVQLRGSYFASRNMVMSLVRLVAVPLAGQIINLVGAPGGYQVNFALALGIGALAFYCYSRLPEHHPTPDTDAAAPPVEAPPRRMPRTPLRLPRTFVSFTVAHATLTLGVMFAAPFFTVYQKEVAGFDVGTIGTLSAINGIFGLAATRIFGRLQDRHGNIWVMRFGVGVALIPLLWIGVAYPLQALLAQMFGTLAWTGYNLGAFNLLLLSTPDEHRPRYVAIYSTITALASIVGPVLGGWLLDMVGFPVVFGLSSVLRACGLILFLALVREPAVNGPRRNALPAA